MADSNTPNFNFVQPEVGSSKGSWGTKLNSNWELLDSILGSSGTTGTFLRRAGGTLTGMLTLPATTPSVDNHAARKRYVDDQVATRLTQAAADTRYLQQTAAAAQYLQRTGGDMVGPIAMQLNNISGLPMPTLVGHAASKQYVDEQIATRLTQTAADARYLRIGAGVTNNQNVQGRVNISGGVNDVVLQLYDTGGTTLFRFRTDGVIDTAKVITASEQPTGDSHLTRKDYVDAQVAARLSQAQGDVRYLRLAGGTMAGDISMGVNQIRGSAPTGPSSFANAQYVQDLVSTRLTQAAADGLYAARTLTLTAGDGLTGGGSLGGNRAFAMGNPGTITSTSTNSVSGTSHTHSIVPATIGILFSENGDVSVGAVITARNEDGPARSFGQNIAGAALRYAGENGGNSTISGTPGGGTWKCKGHAPVGFSTSWVRVS